MTTEEQAKIIRLFTEPHPEYGILCAITYTGGERYGFFEKDGVVSMIPLWMVE